MNKNAEIEEKVLYRYNGDKISIRRENDEESS
jgi:hypothetical protein